MKLELLEKEPFIDSRRIGCSLIDLRKIISNAELLGQHETQVFSTKFSYPKVFDRVEEFNEKIKLRQKTTESDSEPASENEEDLQQSLDGSFY